MSGSIDKVFWQNSIELVDFAKTLSKVSLNVAKISFLALEIKRIARIRNKSCNGSSLSLTLYKIQNN